VQGTAEGAAFPRAQLDRLLDLASIGNSQLFAAQQSALAQALPAQAVAALVATPD
jgi:ribonuclease PH